MPGDLSPGPVLSTSWKDSRRGSLPCQDPTRVKTRTALQMWVGFFPVGSPAGGGILDLALNPPLNAKPAHAIFNTTLAPPGPWEQVRTNLSAFLNLLHLKG